MARCAHLDIIGRRLLEGPSRNGMRHCNLVDTAGVKPRMIRTRMTSMAAIIVVAMAVAGEPAGRGRAAVSREPAVASAANSPRVGVQEGCPLILPAGPVAVSPNQPPVTLESTAGIINALCDVTLDFVGCVFDPTAVTISCDTNGDAVPDL